jgi:hypothetical protein
MIVLKNKMLCASVLLLASILTVNTLADQSPSMEGSSVYIISPQNGDIVNSPVKVVFGLSGMGIAPAGTQIDNTGHHHLLVDALLPSLDAPIPADENNRHFGKGQTETELELSPGQHTLQLLLGDWSHIPHREAVFSQQITITVQ